MSKLDLSKTLKSYYTAKTKPEIIDLPPTHYLSITGQGDPNAEDFGAKVQALYATAYTLKFASKGKGRDFVVAKLEGLWWYDEGKYSDLTMTESVQKVPRTDWQYRLLIQLPDFVKPAAVAEAVETVWTKKQLDLAKNVSLHELHEGKVVQMLHHGPYATEIESLLIMKDFMDQQGFQRNGLHHEIYLSDVNKTAPEKLKTILREPVK